MTSLAHTWLALVLLGIFVQLDILIAPTDLTRSAATHYDLAASPSKGVYLVLTAVSTLIFPYVRVNAEPTDRRPLDCGHAGRGTRRHRLLRGPEGHDRLGARPERRLVPLLVVLGSAMSIAGATGIVINGGIALGVARPWPPLMIGVGGLLRASSLIPPDGHCVRHRGARRRRRRVARHRLGLPSPKTARLEAVS